SDSRVIRIKPENPDSWPTTAVHKATARITPTTKERPRSTTRRARNLTAGPNAPADTPLPISHPPTHHTARPPPTTPALPSTRQRRDDQVDDHGRADDGADHRVAEPQPGRRSRQQREHRPVGEADQQLLADEAQRGGAVEIARRQRAHRHGEGLRPRVAAHRR